MPTSAEIRGGARSVAENMETCALAYLIWTDNDGIDNDLDDRRGFHCDELGEMLLTDSRRKVNGADLRAVRVTMTI